MLGKTMGGGPGSSQSCESPQALLQDLETWGWLWERTPLLYCLLHEGGCAGNSVEEGAGSRIKPGVLYRVTVTANGQEAAVPPWQPRGPEGGEDCKQPRVIEGTTQALVMRAMLTLMPWVRGQCSLGSGVCGPDLSWFLLLCVERVVLCSWCGCGAEAGRAIPLHCSTGAARAA